MRVIVTGAGGFIGGHLVNRLIEDGHEVVTFDSKPLNEWWQPRPDALNFSMYDISKRAMPKADRLYHLACDMGGIGFIEANKLQCAFSTRTDLNVIEWALNFRPDRLFYASSACVYPADRQRRDTHVQSLNEDMTWPADPEAGYGLQKLYTEEMLKYLHDEFEHEVRIGRFHTVYGPHGTWDGGREKAPAALCRKIALAKLRGYTNIQVWGDGTQVRSFMYVDDAVDGVIRLTDSDYHEPVNIGSSDVYTVEELARTIMKIADAEHLEIKYVEGALGVHARNSDNALIKEVTGWEPNYPLAPGLERTYAWVYDRVKEAQ